MACISRELMADVIASLPSAGAAGQRQEPVSLPLMYFVCSWLAIGVISAYDAYLVKVVGPVILSFERNPVCAWLIHWDPHDLSYFFLAKGMGTALVLTILLCLFRWKRTWALPVITGVTAFQVGLLAYLNLASH